jgi:hypothetical protein
MAGVMTAKRNPPTYVYCNGAFYLRHTVVRGRYKLVASPPAGIVAVQIGGTMAADPGHHGMFIRTARCVHLVACTHCGSAIGVPCKKTHGGYGVDTHNDRRVAASMRKH